jgi:hypothetical protein
MTALVVYVQEKFTNTLSVFGLRRISDGSEDITKPPPLDYENTREPLRMWALPHVDAAPRGKTRMANRRTLPPLLKTGESGH